MRILFLCFFSLLTLHTPAIAGDFPRLYQVTGVAADDVLNVREAPDASSAIIGGIAPDFMHIEVTATSADMRWGQVNFHEFSGWVAMRYMQDMGNPPWWELRRPLFCSGTEPFWHAIIDADTSGGMEFSGLDMDTQNFQYDWLRDDTGYGTPDSPKGIIANFVNTDRRAVAVLNTTTCGDGMSDQSFGISAQITLSVDDPGNMHANETYYGCCSLNLP